MSAYLVHEDTIALLASIGAYWRTGPHVGGLYVYATEYPIALTEDTPAFDIFNHDDEEQMYRFHYGAQSFEDLKRELYAGNVVSLQTRYPDDWADLVHYEARQFKEARPVYKDEVTFGEVLGALRCYEYQSCETNGYETSFTKSLVNALTKKVIDIYSNGWEFKRNPDAPIRISLSDLAKS